MSQFPSALRPGVTTPRRATARRVMLQNGEDFISKRLIIDGSESRDPGNTGYLDVLRSGLLMGEITATGLYAPSIIGVITGAYTSGGTELTVSAAQAVELDRIVGQSGSAELVCVGPPSAAGTVAVTDVTHSAIDTSTGVITVSSLGVNKIAGSFICRKDGRQLPKVFIPDLDAFGLKVTDENGVAQDIEFPLIPVDGIIDSSQIINWPSDTSLQAWIVSYINASGMGTFKWDHLYS